MTTTTAAIQKFVTEAPYWRTANPDQYAQSKEIKNVAPSTYPPALTPILRASWKYPQRVSVESALTAPITDPSVASAFGNVVTAARARLHVEYGDAAGTVFKRDVPVGEPLEICASFVDVRGYIDPLGNITNAALSPAPTAIKTTIAVAVLEGTSVDYEQGAIDGTEYANPGLASATNTRVGPSFLHGTPFELYGSARVHALTGFQESGSDLYVHLFDWTQFHTGPEATILPDGSEPRYEFKAPDGVNFSLVVERGLLFQHGVSAVFSSTPGKLTRVDASLMTFRANWRFSLPYLRTPSLFPRVYP